MTTASRTPTPIRHLARGLIILALGAALAAIVGCSCQARSGDSGTPEVRAKGAYEAGGGYSR